ncbi:HNH endonuclease [Ferrimonas balearica]|uniref:HNH endonuclease n=1 Tax=Ferrimonas balearica TaxID=44012 RepID=UPI001C58F6FC|nr:HNH endonuclease [Ferrimonas balearica]MBW3164598.1 HNH endonuclease [Ferrimonas balearica]
MYWWVNHSQTQTNGNSRRGFLWSPKVKANGYRHFAYDNMTEVRTGDVVFSYAKGYLNAWGAVQSPAVSALKPKEFSGNNNWNQDGWLVEVKWNVLGSPISPKDHIAAIKPLLPIKYSPLDKNFNGNEGCYLTQISESLSYKLFELIGVEPGKLSTTHVEHGVSEEPAHYQNEQGESSLNSLENSLALDLDEIANSGDLSDSERQSHVLARIGQGKFRKDVINLWGGEKCAVTLVKVKEMLIASHIKAWKGCESTEERLDGANGILLCAHLDKLFDHHLITFFPKKSHYTLVASEALDIAQLKDMGVEKGIELSTTHLDRGALKRFEGYMAHHNAEFERKQSEYRDSL